MYKAAFHIRFHKFSLTSELEYISILTIHLLNTYIEALYSQAIKKPLKLHLHKAAFHMFSNTRELEVRLKNINYTSLKHPNQLSDSNPLTIINGPPSTDSKHILAGIKGNVKTTHIRDRWLSFQNTAYLHSVLEQRLLSISCEVEPIL